MINVAKLKSERAGLIAGMRALTDAAEARDDHKFTEAEAETWARTKASADELTRQLERAEYLNEAERAGAEPEPVVDTLDIDTRDAVVPFRSFGEQLMAIRAAASPGAVVDERLLNINRAASGQNEANPADGGFLVQTDHQTDIFKRAFEIGQIASRCQRIQVGEAANGISWNAVDESSRVTGSRFGGVVGYWSSEAETVSTSKLKFRKTKMDLEKLMAILYATEENLADSVQLDSLMTEGASEELAWLLDDAILAGSGAGKPQGVYNSDCVVSVAAESGQVAATIVYENIVKMRARQWARSRANSVWVMNQDIEPELQTMALVVGTGGVPVYLPATGAAGSPYDTLFGRPLLPVEQAKTLGTVGDITLADFSQYRLIEKGGIKKDVSIHVRFLYDEQAFRFTYRVNGQPLWDKPLTPANGSNTQSPFITLASRT